MALQAMDDVIASLLDGIHAEGLSSCINMILLADHGKGRSCVYVWYSKLYICFLEMLTNMCTRTCTRQCLVLCSVNFYQYTINVVTVTVLCYCIQV